MRKLEIYGVRGVAIDWVSSCQTYRSQIVEIEPHIKSNVSKQKQTLKGVPSLLGPLLFLVYIIDLPLLIKNGRSTLFVDDITTKVSPRSLNESLGEAQKNIGTLIDPVESTAPKSLQELFFIIGNFQ